jgi:hypothetical protein
MSKKMAGLQQALKSTATAPTMARPEKRNPRPVPTPDDDVKPENKVPSRLGKENISTWLHPDFKKSLRLAQLRKGGKVYLDDLIAEALNDLFIKCDVPTVNHD